MKKSTLKRILASILFAAVFFTSPSSAVTAEEAIESVDTSDYAPGLFYPYYDYKGEGMEFAPFTLTLDYEPDEDGIYQVSRANAGNTVSYVYQLTQDGVIELAYFPNSYEAEDFRYHEDSLDEQVATFFPVELAVGDTFKRGYRDEQEFTVTDILTEHEVEGETYHDVLVIESVMPEGEVQRYYYAPEIGEIASEYIFDDEGNAITTALSEYGEVPAE